MTRRNHAARVPAPPRDQDATAFTGILSELVSRVPGACAAALVDLEGETVDYAGSMPPFDVKVAGAQWRVVLDELRGREPLSRTSFIAMRASRASYQIHALPEGYALMLAFTRAAGFGGWRRAVSACSFALAREACWRSMGPASADRWYAARVSVDARGRPTALEGGAGVRALEILGAVASGARTRERGWRVRVDNGVELTVVREPGGAWYVDDANVLDDHRR